MRFNHVKKDLMGRGQRSTIYAFLKYKCIFFSFNFKYSKILLQRSSRDTSLVRYSENFVNLKLQYRELKKLILNVHLYITKIILNF